jgi:osmotically-inducible protein OsmY
LEATVNDQNRYRGSSQRNQNEGRGSWNRDDESSLLDRGNSPRAGSNYRDERLQSNSPRGEFQGRYEETASDDDRPYREQDREYRGGSSGFGRSRDYQSEWSGYGASGGNYGSSSQDRYGSRDRSEYGAYRDDDRNSASSSYGSGSFRTSPSYGSGANAGSSSRSGYGAGSYGGEYGSNRQPSRGLFRNGRESGWGESNYSALQGTSYSGRGPKGYTRSDERIREDVCERLSDNDEVDASEIEVQVKDRKVTLIGTVQNRRMKHIAEDLAEAVSGVDDVENRITVIKPFLKDVADRITGNEGEHHYANTGTKNNPASSSTSTGGLQAANGR